VGKSVPEVAAEEKFQPVLFTRGFRKLEKKE